MKQWIMQRYNKGQDYWKIRPIKPEKDDTIDGFYDLKINEYNDITLIKVSSLYYEMFYIHHAEPDGGNLEGHRISLYDFLFNPNWGFAKAFFKTIKHYSCADDFPNLCECEGVNGRGDCVWIEDGKNYKDCPQYQVEWIEDYEYHLQQMAISDNPLEYLEQFKDDK